VMTSVNSFEGEFMKFTLFISKKYYYLNARIPGMS